MARHAPIEFTTTPRTQTVRIPGWARILLFIAYILPGNIGHAPWRGDDVLHIAAAADMLRNAHWLVPHIAGAPIFDNPPLHYWLGAASGWLFGWLLPLHEAIRLATMGALAFGLWALLGAARRFAPDSDTGAATLLLALATLGLLIHAHEAQPLITGFAALSGVLLGLSQLDENPRRAGLIAGTATGCAFLATGLPGLLLAATAWAAAAYSKPQLFRTQWRSLMPGVALALLLACSWPLWLLFQDHVLFLVWWHREVFDLVPHLDGKRLVSVLGMLSWFAWPLWPIAGWALWRRRQHLREAAYAVPMAMLVLALWLVLSTGSIRPANALVVVPPLIILAAGEAQKLRRGAANLLDWFAIITFTLIGAFLWLAWCALHMSWPAGLARNIARLAPDFTSQLAWWTLPIALTLSLGWILALWRMPRFPLRGAFHGALGITLAWGLATTLWLDWFDFDRNYSQIAERIASQAKIESSSCVMGIDVGGPQQAAIEYFTQLSVAPYFPGNDRCKLLLLHATSRGQLAKAPEGWTLLWQQEKGKGRLGEKFALYRRGS